MTANVYADMADEINERAARRAARDYDGPCIGRDPSCPCNDGDACHYKDTPRTKAWPLSCEQKWDTLWRAACAVMAAHEQYTQPNTPRPMPGIFRELDHLDEQCAKLRRVIEDICPDPGLVKDAEPIPPNLEALLGVGELTRSKAFAISQAVAAAVEYRGAILGKVHTWYADGDYFNVRILDSGELVNCHYAPKDYETVHELFADKNRFVHVSGMITANLVTHKIESITADRYHVSPSFDEQDYIRQMEKLAGLHGDLSTKDFVAWFRDEDLSLPPASLPGIGGTE